MSLQLAKAAPILNESGWTHAAPCLRHLFRELLYTPASHVLPTGTKVTLITYFMLIWISVSIESGFEEVIHQQHYGTAFCWENEFTIGNGSSDFKWRWINPHCAAATKIWGTCPGHCSVVLPTETRVTCSLLIWISVLIETGFAAIIQRQHNVYLFARKMSLQFAKAALTSNESCWTPASLPPPKSEAPVSGIALSSFPPSQPNRNQGNSNNLFVRHVHRDRVCNHHSAATLFASRKMSLQFAKAALTSNESEWPPAAPSLRRLSGALLPPPLPSAAPILISVKDTKRSLVSLPIRVNASALLFLCK